MAKTGFVHVTIFSLVMVASLWNNVPPVHGCMQTVASPDTWMGSWCVADFGTICKMTVGMMCVDWNRAQTGRIETLFCAIATPCVLHDKRPASAVPWSGDLFSTLLALTARE